MGPRGDDEARSIRFNQYGSMQIYGVEFNFNLTDPIEKHETHYRFLLNEERVAWEYDGLQVKVFR